MADPMRYEMRQQSGSEKRRAWHVSNWTDTLVGHHRLEDVDHGVLGVFRGASKMLQCWDPAIHWFIFIPHPWRGLIIAWHCGKGANMCGVSMHERRIGLAAWACSQPAPIGDKRSTDSLDRVAETERKLRGSLLLCTWNGASA